MEGITKDKMASGKYFS